MSSSAAHPRASLFLTTYEMLRHLELVLAGLGRQSVRDFEVLLCDDGSGPETRQRVDAWGARTGQPLQYFWQEQKGFRKCRILNEALRAARGDTLIFLDGDCIPHRHYVKDHLQQQEAGRYLAGRRVNLGEQFSKSLTPADIEAGLLDGPGVRLFKASHAGQIDHLQRTLRVPFGFLRKMLGMTHVDDLLGSNYSVSRRDLTAINGFDEAYEGYGREDTDAELRLQNMGLRIKSLKGLALQFHIWHPRRAFTPANDNRLEIVKHSGKVRCERGAW